MTLIDQRIFVQEIIENVKHELLKKSIPKKWESLELRWWIADSFQRIVLPTYKGDGLRKRRRDFKNDEDNRAFKEAAIFRLCEDRKKLGSLLMVVAL